MILDKNDPALIALISGMAEQLMTDQQIATVLDADKNHVWAFRKHNKIKSALTYRYMTANRDDSQPSASRIETDEMAEKFANLMAGQSFSHNVKTKSYGRQHNPEPSHIMTQSGLARCG